MKLVAIHTVPIWRERDGSLSLGLKERKHHPPVVGWCNMARIRIGTEVRWFLLTDQADR